MTERYYYESSTCSGNYDIDWTLTSNCDDDGASLYACTSNPQGYGTTNPLVVFTLTK